MEHYYQEDLVCLKSNPYHLGTIEITHSDVSSHLPDPVSEYQAAIQKGKGITKEAFRAFLRTGVPPKGTALVEWIHLPWQDKPEPLLVRESELKLVDRALQAGDVVKKDLASPMSGTVLSTSTTVSLVQPAAWPTATSTASARNPEEWVHNYLRRPEQMVHQVSTQDLKLASDYQPGQFVMYKNWVGKVLECYEDVYIRLSNGSVVVVEVPDELETYREDESSVVGDFVRCKKANLRRGRWIYGSYDPSIEPEGFVADIRPTSVEVSWLAPVLPATAGDNPSYELDEDILQSGEVHIVDRTRTAERRLTNLDHIDPALVPGDCVRFRDVSVAAVKYQGLHRVPRTESLGFDINVFMVAKTTSTVNVRWQDNTTSTCVPSNDLLPYLDMAESGDVWPGDLVEYNAKQEPAQDVVKPAKVGIVESADPRSRLAKVRWFDGADISYTIDDDLAQLLPGSYCGALAPAVEDMSFYELAPIPGFERRIGDFVCFVADEKLVSSVAWRPELIDFAQLLVKNETTPQNNHDMFGEVLELGIDGMLTVRLVGAESIRDVKVPWDGTLLVAGFDAGDSEADDDEMDVDEYDSFSDDGSGSSWDSEGHEYFTTRRSHLSPEDIQELGPWVDEDENIVDSEQEEWATDDEDGSFGDTEEEEPEAMNNQANAEQLEEIRASDEDAIMPDIAEPCPFTRSPLPPQSTFTYNSFNTSQLEGFAVLDSPVPQDHAYVNNGTSTLNDAARMRRIHKEHNILWSSLPAGVYVRTWESRLDLMRVLMLGPIDTPYEYAPFIVDLWLGPSFPHEAPKAFFHSWTRGTGPVNPNLYEDGKICLSLLGTWPGDSRNETWGEKSTVLQILVSILGLVLVKMPYYNEAGYDVRQGTVEAQIPAALYSEKAYFATRSFINHALTKGVPCFDDVLKRIYCPSSNIHSPQLLRRAILEAIRVARRSETREEQHDEQFRVSAGALILLRREIEGLLDVLRKEDSTSAEALTAALRDANVQLPDISTRSRGSDAVV